MATIKYNGKNNTLSYMNVEFTTYINIRRAMTTIFNHIHNNKRMSSIIMNDLETYKHINIANFIVYNFTTCVNKDNVHKMPSFIHRLNSVISKTKTIKRRIENINKICVEFVGETLKYCSINLFLYIDTPNKGFTTMNAIDIYDIVNDITPVAYCVPFSEQTFGLMCVHESEIPRVFDKINSRIAVLQDCDNATRVKMFCAENHTQYKSRKDVFNWSNKGHISYINITTQHSIPLTKVIENSTEWSMRQ